MRKHLKSNPPQGQTDGPDNLELLPNCEFPAACEDETPVCGSNCQMYPNVCYMKLVKSFGNSKNWSVKSVQLTRKLIDRLFC